MRGQLVISSLMSISHRVLPATLVAFRKRHPKMYVQIREGLTSAVTEDVRSGVADFGIGNATRLPEGVVAASIINEPCYVVLTKRHRLAAAPFVSGKEIGDEPMISMPSASGLRRPFDIAASERAIFSTHSIVPNQLGSLFVFVAQGFGFATAPAAVLPPSNGSRIMVKPLRPAITRR